MAGIKWRDVDLTTDNRRGLEDSRLALTVRRMKC